MAIYVYHSPANAAPHRPLPHHPESGHYVCSCCRNPVFPVSAGFAFEGRSLHFRKPLRSAVVIQPDLSRNIIGTDVLCARCQQHLGNMTREQANGNGQPGEAGLRFAIALTAIHYVSETTTLQELR